MNPEEIAKLYTQQRQDLGQRYADRAGKEAELRKGVYSDPDLERRKGNRDTKIRELWDHDKRLAERYANPESEVYLRDPYKREVARSQQFQGTLGEIQDIGRGIETRRDTLGDILENSIRMMEYGVKAEEMKLNSLIQEFQMAMKLQEAKDKASGTADSSANLQAFFDSITGFQEKVEQSKPVAEGFVKKKSELYKKQNKLAKQYPDAQFRWEKAPGGFRWYGMTEERMLEGDPQATLNKLLAGAKASDPGQRTDYESIFGDLVGEEEGGQEVVKELISEAIQAKEKDWKKDKFIQIAKLSYTELSEQQIRQIINKIW